MHVTYVHRLLYITACYVYLNSLFVNDIYTSYYTLIPVVLQFIVLETFQGLRYDIFRCDIHDAIYLVNLVKFLLVKFCHSTPDSF